MSRTKKILVVLLIFFTGALTSSIFEWLQPITTVEIQNVSSKTITEINIEHNGLGSHIVRLATVLKPSEKTEYKWITDGEAGYQLWATFDDGSQVTGGLGYAERGTGIKEVIDSNRIMSSRQAMLTFGLIYNDPVNSTKEGFRSFEQFK